MAFIPQQQVNTGLYYGTTNVWDVSALADIDVTSPEFRELLVRLYQNINNISLALNQKESAIYINQEFVNGQQWFSTTNNANDTRSDFRKVVDCSMLPNTGVKLVPHGILVTPNTTWTHIYGTATDPVNLLGIPLPYASPVLANNIELSIDQTNVIITTGSNRTTFTRCYVVLEWLKN